MQGELHIGDLRIAAGSYHLARACCMPTSALPAARVLLLVN